MIDVRYLCIYLKSANHIVTKSKNLIAEFYLCKTQKYKTIIIIFAVFKLVSIVC